MTRLPERLLIANRGEIAIRIGRTATDMGIGVVSVHTEDDAAGLHVEAGIESVKLPGIGAAGYLDVDAIVGAAVAACTDALHPGYGFLSERAELATACAHAGITFVGPTPETLDLFGDKVRARLLAARCDVPVLRGIDEECSPDQARGLLAELGEGAAVMLKAVAGGGGRGMRVVDDPADLDAAWARCQSEAQAAFGDGSLFVEEHLPHARHIEVQLVGDGSGAVVHLGDRECSIQRRNQKLIEVAPALGLPTAVREQLWACAVRVGAAVRLRGLATVEFLVDTSMPLDDDSPFAFLEVNPRLQVEHTVTEQITGLDLVELQLHIAAGATLDDLGMVQDLIGWRGLAVQARVNLETLGPDGEPRPTSGTIAVLDVPTGPGVRVDTHAHSGFVSNPRYDSLLAKIVVRAASGRPVEAMRRASRAVGELRTDGVETNASFLRAVLDHPDVANGLAETRFVADNIAELLDAAATYTPTRPTVAPPSVVTQPPVTAAAPAPGLTPITAPLHGTIVTVDVVPGDEVAPRQQLAVVEAMKMEHVVTADLGGVVRHVAVAPGETVADGQLLLTVEEGDAGLDLVADVVDVDLDLVRPDLSEVEERHAITLDGARPDAVARRRATDQRTARENLADLCDPGSFIEYGSLMIAAQRKRRTLDDLIARTPADGLVGGIGTVNGAMFPGRESRCVVMSYDYTVLAGTQGTQNHRKKDRLFEMAKQQQLPVVLFSEGGGGRPGDTDGIQIAGLDCLAFELFAGLSGLVPLVGINSGRCFAGNAALLGCCDVVIATADSTIGMGGPAMIEGGGLGVYTPDEVGPIDVQTANGVVDIAVHDEAEAVLVAKEYLSYFQGRRTDWQAGDQRRLRHVIPENRLRVYEIRSVVEALFDVDSVLELRRGFGLGMLTALARIEGRAVGVVANDPRHLGGAIDSDGADKAARFLQLCDAHDLPVVFLCDTPGIMVGPDAEATGTVRHAARLFVIGANLSVPFCTIVLRKGYGLGAQTMAGGSFKAPIFTVGWPTSEFGGMGLEGAVRLGYRKELEAVDDPDERAELFETMVARMYEVGKGLNYATAFEIDDVIDPAETRRWITTAFDAAAPAAPRTGKKRPWIDTW